MATPPVRDPVPCILIPAFNEECRIGPVVSGALVHGYPVVVIDDGSTDGTGALVRSLGAEVVRHEVNLGKGASLVSGFDYARKHGHTVVVTLDADGQHDPAEITRFLDTYRRTGIPVLIGNRMWNDAGMPLVRRWTNRAMSKLLCRIMKTHIPDTQCGFRLYRTDVLSFAPAVSRRFAMESEVLLHLALRGFRMDSVRISTIYQGSRSRINPLVDTLRFIMMLVQFHHDRQMRRTKAG